ncbi:Defensin-like (DEFL) family protein [Arabidopsis thaliana]|uniref:Putative defensin-like protein 28 n=1 Tax=Arabidopsis thaliana TaxID=3702 RepID=DEF28_ARATH|nr:Defensin-like (DEFL) family protein [Arabidopsis thaliana]P0CAY0.1 PUTATIVE PSEUDOGENE: RecName: Full=Putative defensin-like protein 28; Flags: Precursor [Arabidopsis thaliana]AEE83407.2 Defensin-like (DEFL) family protein [Arabidopsis thaliana]|eukprot:NP_001031635.5 Defensin-like (DEFL) family protein [Arabidopsis thaliana]
MLRANVVVSLVIFAALMQCMNGKENITPWIYSMKQPVSCNREHSEIGICLSGIDDDIQNDGKCWKFCLMVAKSGGYNADK